MRGQITITVNEKRPALVSLVFPSLGDHLSEHRVRVLIDERTRNLEDLSTYIELDSVNHLFDCNDWIEIFGSMKKKRSQLLFADQVVVTSYLHIKAFQSCVTQSTFE
jgi:hypothetical protein